MVTVERVTYFASRSVAAPRRRKEQDMGFRL
jgi:hypothetical protein